MFVRRLTGAFLLSIALAGVAKATQFDEVKRAMQQGDVAGAFRISSALAAAGDTEAQYALGTLYAAGKGTAKDDAKALEWYTRAAEQGEPNAIYAIGMMFGKGRGVAQDATVSAKWFLKAALQGHVEGQYATGVRYATGLGFERNEAAASRWIQRAADQGSPAAQLALAKMLASGRGATMDKLAAYAWANLAQTRSTDAALRDQVTALGASIARELTPGQLTQAKAVAAKWSPLVEQPLRPIGVVTHQQNGILASLFIRPGEAIVNWRSADAEGTIPREIIGTIGGATLGAARLEPYPGPGAKTSALFLLDISDNNPPSQIQRNTLTIADIVGRKRPYQQIDLASYGESFQFLSPEGADIGAMLGAIQLAKPKPAGATLWQSLDKALDISLSTSAQRRGIFILTSARIEGARQSSALVEKAKLAGVSLNFILASPDQAKDLFALETIARATGGEVVSSAGLDDFLKDPFRLLESGAIVTFPFEHPADYLSNSMSDVKIFFQFADTRFEIAAKATDRFRLERAALEDILKSCDGACSSDLKPRIQARLELIFQEQRNFAAAENNVELLHAYVGTCGPCNFREEAETRIAEVETQRFYAKLDKTGNSPDALQSLLAGCVTSCSASIKAELVSRIELAKQFQVDERAYLAARDSLASLKSYLQSCENCPYAGNAQQDIKLLEFQELQQAETQAFESARGDISALRRYLQACSFCAHASDAREGIAWLEQEQSRRDAPPEHWIAVAGSVTSGRVARVAAGYSGLRSSEVEAQSAALSQCRSAGGGNCKVQPATNSGCLYIATGSASTRVSWGSGPTEERAAERCRSGGFVCRQPIGGCVD